MSDDTAKLIEEVNTDNQSSVSYNDETVIWEGRPSQWVNIGSFLWWGAFLIASTVLLVFWQSGLNEGYSQVITEAVYWACYGLVGLSIFSLVYAYLSVRYEHTVITRNKIKEAKGITSIFRQELFCEISDIKDIHSPPAGLLGLVGLSTLVIETNDDDQPIIKIRAIKNRNQLIEMLLPIWRKLKIERKGYFGDR
ncbi:hypothetical protein ACJJI4_23770 (plasmid) [Microbulbifer sp. TRSA002]|uniref:hypothetical protein n=1 Tax=Microbulbifer sp. TRSA002 TaxID=3243382 RepID=UPI00403926CD